MAIEVIKKGDLKATVYVGTCPTCGAVLEALHEDFVFEDRPCGMGLIKCPTLKCNGKVVIDNCKKRTRSNRRLT